MRSRLTGSTVVIVSVAAIALAWFTLKPADGQTAAYMAPRTADGKPNLNGIWQTVNSASWDLQDHVARPGAVAALGAFGAVPGGLGVVEGNEIPYQPWATAKKQENLKNALTLDPALKCFLPGVPRATYLPLPLQITQTPQTILISYEFASAARVIPLNKSTPAPVDTWMGWSNGRWEGETLVVDVTGFNDQTWFDRAGNFHSEALHVVERYTPISPDALRYEATIEDPKVFTRPWKISMPLYRRLETNAMLMDFKCVEFAEELLYGHLRKRTAK